jgi:hypothetical protein
VEASRYLFRAGRAAREETAFFLELAGFFSGLRFLAFAAGFAALLAAGFAAGLPAAAPPSFAGASGRGWPPDFSPLTLARAFLRA